VTAARLLLLFFACLAIGSRAASAETPPSVDCPHARQVVTQALNLMQHSARDESTQLRVYVRDGWQTPFANLTIIRSFDVNECQTSGVSARVSVDFDVAGRLVGVTGNEALNFIPDSQLEKIELEVVDVDGVARIADLSHLEPHVGARYANQILTEVANAQPSIGTRIAHLSEAISSATQ